MDEQGLFGNAEDSLKESASSQVAIPSDIVCPLPAWIPEKVRRAVIARVKDLSGAAYLVRFSRAERKILRKRRKIACSEWSEKHRYLTMSSMPGPWRNEVTPYLVGIMNGAQFSSVRVISICKCPQSGVTEAVHNFIGCAIDQDPGPVLYTFPDRDTADENSRDRILPMIKSSRRLKGYLSGTRNDESMMRINLAHMPIYLSWASSPARLGNKPIKHAVWDETDKSQTRGSRETGPGELIDKRLVTYREVSKFFKISTPTIETGIIWITVTKEAEVVFYYWVRCPECGRVQLMTDERIICIDAECADPRVVTRKNLGRYLCEHCETKWDDHMRNQAVAMGQWRAQGPEDPRGLELHAYLETHRPHNIAFHLPAWIPRFNTLSYCLAARLEADTGDLDKRKNYANQIQAIPYKKIVVEPVASRYRSAICTLPAQTAPAEAVALTCGLDCQKTGFYFLVRAWARDYMSWMIHYGRIAIWEDIETLLFNTTYPVADSDRRMAIARAAIDTGGSKFNPDMSMTEQAYWWIRKNGVGRGARCWGTKGASWPQAHRVKVSKPIDRTPSGKPIPGGLQILVLDTEKLKDAFFWRLEQAVEKTAMAAWLHADTGDEYFSHITAEHKVEDDKGVLQWTKKAAKRNDWLDCEIMAAAAADPEWPEGGVHLMAPVTELASIQHQDDPARPNQQRERDGENTGYDMPSWIRSY